MTVTGPEPIFRSPTSCTLADLTIASAASMAPTSLFQPVPVRYSYRSPVIKHGDPERDPFDQRLVPRYYRYCDGPDCP